jgi:hypothetical protein
MNKIAKGLEFIAVEKTDMVSPDLIEVQIAMQSPHDATIRGGFPYVVHSHSTPTGNRFRTMGH